ncbi:MAG TPA: ABC transporter substrate-binding protein, partial [Yinghuangia sp.]|nr:ABC transporter substrate-binding protein [Yinghuangia sp.]
MIPRARAPWRRTAVLTVAAALTAGLAACGDAEQKAPAPAAAGDGCIENFDPNTDYFPVKSTLKYAQNFTVVYEKSYQILTVKQPVSGGKPERYVLVKCGAPDPKLDGDLADAPRVTVPITSMYSASTTHLPLLTDLGRLGLLTGVANAKNVSGADARARIDAGQVVEYAPGRQINTEKVVTERPDILMTGGTDEGAYAGLRAAGIKVVANAEWLENDPLGRAEWVKYMAAFTGDEAKAAGVFDRIDGDYRAVAAKATSAPPVKVLPGQLSQGTWSVASGGSYVGKLIRDAGGTYPWIDERSTGSLQVNFEQVFARGGDAAVWLVSASDWRTYDDVVKADPRYREFTAFKNDRIWSNNLAMGPGGGNDYWERGVTRPDLVLADLVAILHPDLMPGHVFT